MPSKQQFIDEVDALHRPRKALVGGEQAVWRMGREPRERVIKLPLEIDGQILGPELVMTAFPLEVGKFSISLVHHVAVARLDVERHAMHTNPLDALGQPKPTDIHGSHFHRWALNTRYVESYAILPKLRMAEPYAGSENFMPALRWVAGELKIVVPHDVNIVLPPNENLF